MLLATATDADLPAIAALVNSAYRGERSRQGWTTEAGLLDGTRTDVATLRADLAATPGARVLLLREGDGADPEACVWLQPADGDAWYLGMLTVRPDAQDRGTGRQLLNEAEATAKTAGARRMRMTVIGLRDTLIAWYERRGYVRTGETQPFTHDDRPRPELTFVVLEKRL